MRKSPELTVGAFILDRRDNLLLVVSHKWFYLYSIPGGHVNYGEKIFDAVVREAREEVGIEVKPEKVIAIQEVCNPGQFYKKGRHFIFVDVLCRALSTDVKADHQEIQGYVWTELRRSLQLPLEKYTRRLVEHYLSSKPTIHPKFFSDSCRQGRTSSEV
ncbi:MAG: NUDIX domain-containing protein [Candidatus Caldarchaeum sp.]